MSPAKSVKRALDIINLYAEGNYVLGVTEVAKELHLTKSTVSRLMSTLESAGILRRTEKERKYCLWTKIMKLAEIFVVNSDLKIIALPYMEALEKKIGETICLNVLDGDERLCVAAVETSQPLRHVTAVGERGPLHAGAPGKLLLAYLPVEKVKEIISRTGLPRFTGSTITSEKKLKAEIERIRKQGFALSNAEHRMFCFSVSAPIRNYTGEVIAALTIAGVSMRADTQKRVVLSKLVKEIAENISHDLGYWDGLVSQPDHQFCRTCGTKLGTPGPQAPGEAR